MITSRWSGSSPDAWTPLGRRSLGRGLAVTHAAGAGGFGDPQLGGVRSDVPSRFGSLSLSNEPTADWPSFYAERRLRPLALLAHERRALSDSGLGAVERVCERIADLAGPAEPPARLHGDLWGGNVLADVQGRPWLIDPSAYGGHREVDLTAAVPFAGGRRNRECAR